ncbi:MAG: hypothetical protein IPP07_14460 [Holophagales bacterium]|nr:hypothetical protein [Holophagales bacterium]
MRTIRSKGGAGALLAVLAATLLLPLGALARAQEPKSGTHGCHCPVKMACCEAGLCHREEDATPAAGPSWSGCRDEAPAPSGPPAPSTALDSALLTGFRTGAPNGGERAGLVVPAASSGRDTAPATPPPRGSIAPR